MRTRAEPESSPLDKLLAGIAAVAAGSLFLFAPGQLGDVGPVPTARGSSLAHDGGIAPVRVVLAGYVDAPLVPVAAGLDGELEVPKPPSRAGWWALGAAPGAASGTVLLAGHVDSAKHGLGAFAALWAVPVGTRVTVTGADGTRHRYRITARRTYRRTALPADLFGGAVAPRLALVTCVGPYNRAAHRYADNLVLYGVPV